jgi:hypothetical protein
MEVSYNQITGSNYPINHKNTVKTFASFDGGGVRGMIAIRICQAIEEITNRSMVELFDCFAGTSVGSMLAMALNIPKEKGSLSPKYTAREVVEFLKNNAHIIFPQSMGLLRKTAALFTSKYSVTDLSEALKDFYGDMVMSDSIRDIIIPSSEISHGGSPWWFSKQKIFNSENENAPNISEETAKKIHVTDVLKASASAPYYFPFYTIPLDGKVFNFVDGGCYANNPSTIGITYAHLLYGIETPLLVGNFGTGDPPRSNSTPNPYFQGGFYWIWNYVGFSMNLNSDETNLISKIEIQAEMLRNQEQKFHEFQPKISAQEYELDNSSPENMQRLIEATEAYLKKNQLILRNFCNELLIAKGFDPVPVYLEEDSQRYEEIIADFFMIEINEGVEVQIEITMNENERSYCIIS